MLRIFIRKSTENVVNVNDVYFNKYTFRMLDYEKAKEIIKEIDGVELTKNFKIVSKFTGSELDLTKLSTGCKTILNILYNQDEIFNISECGINALSHIYKLSIGNIYTSTLVIPLLEDFSCDIEVISGKGQYRFVTVSELRNWYSEVYMNENETSSEKRV